MNVLSGAQHSNCLFCFIFVFLFIESFIGLLPVFQYFVFFLLKNDQGIIFTYIKQNTSLQKTSSYTKYLTLMMREGVV